MCRWDDARVIPDWYDVRPFALIMVSIQSNTISVRPCMKATATTLDWLLRLRPVTPVSCHRTLKREKTKHIYLHGRSYTFLGSFGRRVRKWEYLCDYNGTKVLPSVPDRLPVEISNWVMKFGVVCNRYRNHGNDSSKVPRGGNQSGWCTLMLVRHGGQLEKKNLVNCDTPRG